MMTRTRLLSRLVCSVSALLAALSIATLAAPARADTLIIKNPGDHPRYYFEAEPHLVLGFIDPPGYAAGAGFGVGFRGSIPLVKNGFVPSINNSVAIGFGLDYARYGRGDFCVGAGRLPDCDRRRQNGFHELYFPVVMQWNFFLSRNWSVFGEPGAALNYHAYDAVHRVGLSPVFYLGGRWHFSERLSITMRIGYPAFAAGVSFLL